MDRRQFVQSVAAAVGTAAVAPSALLAATKTAPAWTTVPLGVRELYIYEINLDAMVLRWDWVATNGKRLSAYAEATLDAVGAGAVRRELLLEFEKQAAAWGVDASKQPKIPAEQLRRSWRDA